jgi:eukaryotic-like serine/threonine-protein kinase
MKRHPLKVLRHIFGRWTEITLLCGTQFVLAGALLAADKPPENPTRATATSWPMFRGGQGLPGVSPSRLPDKLALLWTFKTQGPVKSSPAIVGGRVFVGSNDTNVYALDLRTGHKVWSFKAGDAVESSPLVLGGKVFVGSTDAHVYALDGATGKELWKFQTGDKILSGPNWVASTNAAGAPWILVGSYDYKLYSLDSETGKTNWTYETGNYINGSPAVAGGQTVFGGCDALLHVIALADGTKVKQVEAGAYIAGSGAFEDNRVYIGHYENEFICVDLNEGKRVWTFKDRSFPYFSSPAVTPDRVIFGGRDKKLHCVKKSDGTPVWSFATRGKVDSSPVVCGEKVVVGSDDGRLYVVSLNEGKELWKYEVGEGLTSSPAVAEGRIVIGSDDGNVYCFGAKR